MTSHTLFTISNWDSCQLSRSTVLMSPAAESDTAASHCCGSLPCHVSLLMCAYKANSCLHVHSPSVILGILFLQYATY